MTRRKPQTGWLMSAKERKVFTNVLVILMQIETRLRCKAASSGQERSKKARKTSRESKQEKARDMICLYIKGRGPCFIMQVFYLKATEIFNKGYIHDRYHRSYFNAGYV